MDRNIESFRKITMMICESFDTTLDCECRHAGKDFGGFCL
jgi:5'-methylthioadenosine phosphorylase